VTLSSTDNEQGATGVKDIHWSLSGAQTGEAVVPGAVASVMVTAEGMSTLTYFAVDNAGNVELAKDLTIRLDRTPPVVSGLPEGCTLWPPNHRLVQVATVGAGDLLSRLASFDVTGTSNEPAGDEPDIVITGNGLQPRVVQLRRERLGSGSGRVYRLTANARDLAGNITASAATCIVPHDQGH
jgi:hypothetical protein